jgi:hypothetical protein
MFFSTIRRGRHISRAGGAFVIKRAPLDGRRDACR